MTPSGGPRRSWAVVTLWLALGVFTATMTAWHEGDLWWPQAIAIALAVGLVGSFFTLRRTT